jgi:hypothetical protein
MLGKEITFWRSEQECVAATLLATIAVPVFVMGY